jgi:multicomponent Na+:H+ antiporter subunit B
VLLRRRRRGAAPTGEPAGAEVTAPLRSLGGVLVAPMLVLGADLVAHGHLTPGGGFQGGVLLAAALLLVYAAGHVMAVRRVRPMALVEVTHALGAAAFGLVAVGGLVFAGAAMANFLGFGTESQLLSGGTIPVLNVAVGVEVTGALTLIASEFLEQLLLQGGED